MVVTSTSPCVVTKYLGDFKAEILFPVSPKFCLKLTGKTLLNGREGRYFEQSEEVVTEKVSTYIGQYILGILCLEDSETVKTEEEDCYLCILYKNRCKNSSPPFLFLSHSDYCKNAFIDV